MAKLARRFLEDDRGATSIEYAMIASVVSIVILTAVLGVSSNVKAAYQSVLATFN